MKQIFIGDSEWENMDLRQLDGYSEIILDGALAVSRMEHLRSRGIAAERLSWRDPDGRIFDFLWRHQRWAGDLPKTPADKYLICGLDGLGTRVNWRLPELVLVAGPYASGKSLFAQILAQDFVCRNDQWASLTCWEDQVDEIRDGLVKYRDATIVPEHMRSGFIDRFRLTLVDDDTEREISEHFKRIEYEAKRFGIKFFVLDPWNEFDHRKSHRQTEGEYVIRVMTEATSLCNRLGIILVITTHVSAEFVSHGNKDFAPFRISNAFGTSQFGNKVHRGFCVTRSRKWNPLSHMIVRQDKVKLENKITIVDGKPIVLKKRMGYPDTMAFVFDPNCNTIHHDEDITVEARKIWK